MEKNNWPIIMITCSLVVRKLVRTGYTLRWSIILTNIQLKFKFSVSFPFPLNGCCKLQSLLVAGTLVFALPMDFLCLCPNLLGTWLTLAIVVRENNEQFSSMRYITFIFLTITLHKYITYSQHLFTPKTPFIQTMYWHGT